VYKVNYFVNFYDYHTAIDDGYLNLLSNYIKSNYNNPKIVFDKTYSHHLSVILDDKNQAVDLTEKLDKYYKVESRIYALTDKDIWEEEVVELRRVAGFVGIHQTKIKTPIPYIKDATNIFTTLADTDDYYLNIHRTVYYNSRIESYRSVYPSLYITPLRKSFYFYNNDSSKKLSQGDFFDLLKINPPDHLFWDMFELQTNPRFALVYVDDDAEVELYSLFLREEGLCGSVQIRFLHTRPIKFSTYSADVINAYNAYFNDEDISVLRNVDVHSTKTNAIGISYVNLINPYWVAVLGGILEDRGEKLIPKCFNPESIRKEFQEFQTFETLYQIKGKALGKNFRSFKPLKLYTK